ncbi:hypothetical protein ACRCUN_07715 [Mycobacterium sp. LTG2003]
MIGRSHVFAWKPSTLDAYADGWNKVAEKIEVLFDRYRAAVTVLHGGGHWQGAAADAAQERAELDRQAAVRLADHLHRVAMIAADGAQAVGHPLSKAQDAIRAAEQSGFTVSESLEVSVGGPVTPELSRAMAEWQHMITDLAAAAERADRDVTNALTTAQHDLRVAFISPTGLGSEQARGDAEQLRENPWGLSPEQLQRLREATQLTAAQLNAFQSGEPITIPASQMEYLNALMRELDATSPQELAAKLTWMAPPEARSSFADAMQLVSTERVYTDAPGDSEIPANGGVSLLPAQMRDALDRSKLVDGNQLNKVAENQATAKIVEMSSPEIQHGTGLDIALMDSARTYLDVQHRVEEDGGLLFVDGQWVEPTAYLTEGMFAAVADDKAVVAAELSGPDGDALLQDMFRHEWSDDGRAVSELFEVSAQEAQGSAGDRAAEVRKEQSGDIAETVARYLSHNSDSLLKLPDDAATSAGERNPELLKGVASGLAPYYSSLAGSSLIEGVGAFDTREDLVRMYAVLAGHPESGAIAIEATRAQQEALAGLYGAGGAGADYAQVAGQMEAGLEGGVQRASETLDEAEESSNEEEHAFQEDLYDAGVTAASALLERSGTPYGVAAGVAVDVAGPLLKQFIVGTPESASETDPDNDQAREYYNRVGSITETTQWIFAGVSARDPSLVHEEFADYRAYDKYGNPYIAVTDGNYENVKDRLEMREEYGHGFVKRWQDGIVHGMVLNKDFYVAPQRRF